MYGTRRTDLQITDSEIAHHMAMLSRTHEVRRRLRGPAAPAVRVVIPARIPAPPLVIETPALADESAAAKPARHPLDETLYAFPIHLPAFVPVWADKNYNPNKPRVLPREIIAECARLAGMTVDDILGKSRKPHFARPRQFAMWRVRTETGRSFPETARLFGGRDHSTVLHAARRVERAIAEGILDPADPRRWFALGYNDGRVRRSHA